MKRPQHSLSGFRSYVRMSTHSVFVLVEGKNIDPFFYSSIVKQVCEGAGVTCEIIRSDFVTGTGGKKTLVDLYKYLESVGSLAHQVENGHKLCVFYLDKDVDDVFCKAIPSNHVVYTPYYCVENTLFMQGKLVLAAAAAASLDPADIEARIPDPVTWRQQMAELWKEFLVLSLLSLKLKVNSACHYACMASPLNIPAETPTNMPRAIEVKTELEASSGLSPQKFDFRLRALRRYVERHYRNGRHDILFNGKWYLELLRREIGLSRDAGAHHNPSNLALISALSTSLDFSAEWTEHFRQPLRNLLQTR